MLGSGNQEMPNPMALNAAMNPLVQQFLQQQQSLQASLFSLLKQQQSLPETSSLNRSLSHMNLLGNSTSAVGDGNGNSLERAARFHRSAACKYIFG